MTPVHGMGDRIYPGGLFLPSLCTKSDELLGSARHYNSCRGSDLLQMSAGTPTVNFSYSLLLMQSWKLNTISNFTKPSKRLLRLKSNGTTLFSLLDVL